MSGAADRPCERGAATLPLVGVIAVVVVLTVGIVDVGRYLAARAQAVAAADAAALAAAPVTFRPFGARGSPVAEASRFASANGARLVSCGCSVDRSLARREVEVLVVVPVRLLMLGAHTVRASGRAEFAPAAVVGASSRSRAVGPAPPVAPRVVPSTTSSGRRPWATSDAAP